MSLEEKEPDGDISNFCWTEGEKISSILSKAANAFVKLSSFGKYSLESPLIESKEIKEGENRYFLDRIREGSRYIVNNFKNWYRNPKPFGNVIDTGLLYMTPPQYGIPLSFLNRAYNYIKTGDTGYNYFNRHNWPGQKYYYAQWQKRRIKYYVKKGQRQINKFQYSFMNNVWPRTKIGYYEGKKSFLRRWHRSSFYKKYKEWTDHGQITEMNEIIRRNNVHEARRRLVGMDLELQRARLLRWRTEKRWNEPSQRGERDWIHVYNEDNRIYDDQVQNDPRLWPGLSNREFFHLAAAGIGHRLHNEWIDEKLNRKRTTFLKLWNRAPPWRRDQLRWSADHPNYYNIRGGPVHYDFNSHSEEYFRNLNRHFINEIDNNQREPFRPWRNNLRLIRPG